MEYQVERNVRKISRKSTNCWDVLPEIIHNSLLIHAAYLVSPHIKSVTSPDRRCDKEKQIHTGRNRTHGTYIDTCMRTRFRP